MRVNFMGTPPEDCSEGRGLDINPRFQGALAIMREAYDYALKSHRSVWDFAVEISVLRRRGLTNSDLRWLVCQGIIEHRAEMDAPDEESRTFLRTGGLTFNKRTCFVLTQVGAELTHAISDHIIEPDVPVLPSSSPCPTVAPEWDKERQELRVGGLVVKQFKVPAPNQEMILAAFQEEGWPPRIDDPLPPQAEQDPKRRLHDAINSLNRHWRNRLIRFTGDGSGEGVRWEFVSRQSGRTDP
jgi:hypothetical protein